MILYAFAIFVSSFLLFQVQPLIGKYILPWFGSTPAVWSTSLLFFQALLTGGYAYAYTLSGRFNPRQQGRIHLIVVSFSLLVLLFTAFSWTSPIMPGLSWRPEIKDMPIGDIFRILLVAVGFPYLILSANGPLVQSWFSKTYPHHSPYRLYALSNAASLLGLISYPFVFEPLLPLFQQGWLWAAGYTLYGVTILVLAMRMWRSPVEFEAASNQQIEPTSPELENKRLEIWKMILWALLPACASTLLLAVTNQITQEVAVIPFLWVLPLALYLLSFILTFDSDRWYSRTVFSFLLFGIVIIYLLMVSKGPMVDIRFQIAIFSILLFISCMICHGELARLRPPARFLTSFYLTLSIGGAIGGLFVNLVAPFIFKRYLELPFGLLACSFLLLLVTIKAKLPGQTRRYTRNLATMQVGLVILMGVMAILNLRASVRGPLLIERDFFGVLSVTEKIIGNDREPVYQLLHGITVHGLQYVNGPKRDQPTAYYTHESGGGLVFLKNLNRPGPIRAGILGLGAGVQAAYGQKGDVFRFYEINPDVVRIAEGQGGYFSFLKDSAADVEIVLGDARLSLEEEYAQNGSQNFDVIVVDVFNSDAIPVHLITKEAFEIFLKHLKPDGVLAVHISNNHLDLQLVVKRLAEEFKLGTALIRNKPKDPSGFFSSFVLLSYNQDFLKQQSIASQAAPLAEGTDEIRLWTDEYNNLIQILR